jgi:uncharacterized protein YggT (Ycf19 family)
MLTFLKMILAASIGQILTWMIVQGFQNSYWGKNVREEVTRWIDQLSKHMRKQKVNKEIVDGKERTEA